MKLTQWTLFIDMLGYRDINGSINSEEKAKEFISFMDASRKIFELTDSKEKREQYAKDEHFNLYKYYDIQNSFVSDSLIITYQPREVEENISVDIQQMHSANALFIITIRLQIFIYHCFREKGIFLRGGISNKYCFIKDNFAVGEGLIEAYLGESKYAKNPRIVLHPSVGINIRLMEKIEFLSKKMYGGKSIIKKDIDDLYFLDHLGYAISTTDIEIPMIAKAAEKDPSGYLMTCKSVANYTQKHGEEITKKLKEFNEKMSLVDPESEEGKVVASVTGKFVWLKNYHNSKIEHHHALSKYKVK